MLVHAGKYGKIHKSKTDITKTKRNPEEANRATHNYLGSVTFYDTQPGDEVGLFYNASEPIRGH